MNASATGMGAPPEHSDRHVHGEPGPGPRLARLGFLVGDFEGRGSFADGRPGFHKALTGHAEAGGRYLGLRMVATYTLGDGRLDRHSALVIVGETPAGTGLGARAYTDAGVTHDYEIDVVEDRFVFEDVLPDHGARWHRARKILVPVTGGFDEILEVALEDGAFSVFCTVAMRRVSRPTDERQP